MKENIRNILKSTFLGTFLSIYTPSFAEEINDTKIEIIIDIAGDITPTEDLSDKGRFKKLLNEISKKTKIDTEEIMSYPLSNVKGIFNESYTIANLETRTLTKDIIEKNNELKYKKSKSGNKTFYFATDEKMIDIINPKNSSIEAVSIANNHSKDFGELGFETLKSFVKNKDLKYFGANNNDFQIEYDSYKGIKIAMVSSTIYNSAKLESEKYKIGNAIKKASKNNAQIIVIYYHWGTELSIKPEKYQKELAHFAAEKGATIFAGSHQHVVSGTEKYKTKDGRIVPIAYGLGNFMFGGNINPSDKDSIIFRNNFIYDKETKSIILKDSYNIPIITTGGNKEDKEDKFMGYKQFRPTKATGSDKRRIEEKLNDRNNMI